MENESGSLLPRVRTMCLPWASSALRPANDERGILHEPHFAFCVRMCVHAPVLCHVCVCVYGVPYVTVEKKNM